LSIDACRLPIQRSECCRSAEGTQRRVSFAPAKLGPQLAWLRYRIEPIPPLERAG
jgi:hypothetical protein